jgi:hypothetical protein
MPRKCSRAACRKSIHSSGMPEASVRKICCDRRGTIALQFETRPVIAYNAARFQVAGLWQDPNCVLAQLAPRKAAGVTLCEAWKGPGQTQDTWLLGSSCR